MLIAILIIVLLVVAVGMFVVTGINKLRQQRVSVDEALAGIDVQLTRRAELVPNLVETVKGYASHEKGVFEAVTAARAVSIPRLNSGSMQRARACSSFPTSRTP